jgi:serine protease Do
VGETIIAIGNPLGEFENSVSRGIISGLKRSLEAGSGRGDSEHLSGIIQIDAAINPGNSGGPLLNLSGEVVGVNVAMAQGAENIGFSLPINQVKRIVEQVRTTGKMSFPYLGVRTITLNEELKKKTSLPFDYGALVLRGETMTDFAVVPGSPADKAGIVENDILLEINGERIDEEHSLIGFMGRYAVGDEITVKLWHKGETKDIRVRLEERQ